MARNGDDSRSADPSSSSGTDPAATEAIAQASGPGEPSTSLSSSLSSAPAAALESSDRSELLAQATRFLTSAKISESASDQDKRDFLKSKGLTEPEIEHAFRNAKSPVDGLSVSNASELTDPSQQHGASDEDPFDRARRQFDDPIHADALEPPPKSYPKSPLALYYEAPAQQQHGHQQLGQHGTTDPSANGGSSPLTRYQVLLRFFRTLSLLMMLGGGATALAVSAYRLYILPRITAMFDARSIVLKHHIVLFDKLRDTVNGLATYVPNSTQAITNGASANVHDANGQLVRKGVLKKVHFNDDPHSQDKDEEKEGLKSTQHAEKVVTPGTDVVVEAKTPGTVEREKEAGIKSDETDDAMTMEDGESAPAPAPAMAPIDIMAPVRSSLARLTKVLKANMSSAALNAPTAAEGTGRVGAQAATVQDAGSGSDEWEDEEDEDEASDDGLEFDPYGAYQKKLKHTQATSGSSSSKSKGSRSLSGLKVALSSLNADISTHSFAATSSSYGSVAYPSTFRFGPTSDASANTASNTGADSPKSGDLGQVKAEIRSLKGLLLSRRNFPSYAARPPPPPLPTSTSDHRSTSAVV
ncbi:hypothetical protein BCV70DRAFT_203412 [Testicularia cyperi]|uniref:Peroxisomal membrane protein PEX14 n=1 Tax=Testicularia cyperi TaxID=1882483 RepID=A0A317XEN3_9BASI|nr:hypothetical protein BCV70DRAFT_203412 [Testicularia cyperi]